MAFGGGHAGHHHEAGGGSACIGPFGAVGHGIGDHAHPSRVERQLLRQRLLVRGHADHARGPGGQQGFGPAGVASLQAWRLRLEAEPVHRVDHRGLADLAGHPRHHAGHGAVHVDQVGPLGADEPQQIAYGAPQAQRVQRIAQGRQGRDRYPLGLQCLAQRGGRAVVPDGGREPHAALQGAAQLQHMGLRPAGFAFGDDLHHMNAWGVQGRVCCRKKGMRDCMQARRSASPQ